MKIARILCPTDFSECSEAALELALDMAKRFGAELRLLHVFQYPPYLGWEEGMTMAAASVQLMQELRDRVDDQLEELVERCKRAGVTATAEQVDGTAYAKIAEASPQADLVVMGSHGRTGLPRLFLGSVAERVVRLASCPVISVPALERALRARADSHVAP
jgi:universal stress protein A